MGEGRQERKGEGVSAARRHFKRSQTRWRVMAKARARAIAMARATATARAKARATARAAARVMTRAMERSGGSVGGIAVGGPKKKCDFFK